MESELENYNTPTIFEETLGPCECPPFLQVCRYFKILIFLLVQILTVDYKSYVLTVVIDADNKNFQKYPYLKAEPQATVLKTASISRKVIHFYISNI
jgi:hypothetical protein